MSDSHEWLDVQGAIVSYPDLVVERDDVRLLPRWIDGELETVEAPKPPDGAS